MVTVNLTEGEHTIKWTLEGYNNLEAKIRVGPTGAVTCISVTGGVCGAAAAPKIVISGTAVTGYLKTVSTPTPTPAPTTTPPPGAICTWITAKGGWSDISPPELFELIDAYMKLKSIGFTPTAPQVLGTVDYYLGFKSSGNSKTGCTF